LGAFQYNPAGGYWAFHGSAGLAANGSAFTSANPAAPRGFQAAFVQATGSISQSVGFPAGTYDIGFSAAQRGNSQASTQTFEVLVDGHLVAAFNNLAGTTYTTLTTSSFTITAASHTVAFLGTDLHGGDNAVLLDQIVINPADFNTPIVGKGAYQYNPGGSPWTFQGSAGLAGDDSAFTRGTAPEGVQVAFVQALGSISQSVTIPAGTYTIGFNAAQRSIFFLTHQSFEVLVDGNVVGTFNSLALTDFIHLATPSFAVTTGSHTITFQGTDVQGGDNTVLLDQVAINQLPTNLADASFETPVVSNGGLQYNPVGSPWTYSGSAGLAGNNSIFTSGYASAPEGSQAAFIQGLGSISQSVTFPAGTYSISFYAALRGNSLVGQQTFEVLVDGKVVATFDNLTATNYTVLTTPSFTVPSGKHIIAFRGTDLNGGDNPVVLDQIAINLLA